MIFDEVMRSDYCYSEDVLRASTKCFLPLESVLSDETKEGAGGMLK